MPSLNETQFLAEIRSRLRRRQTLWVQNPQTQKAQPIMVNVRELERLEGIAAKQHTTISRLLFRRQM